jgi:hypothetical protein
MDVIQVLAAHGKGGGLRVGQDLPVQIYEFVDVKKTIWSKATTYNLNNVHSLRYRQSANEIYALSRKTKQVFVHDAATGVQKRTINLPLSSDPNFEIATYDDLIVTEDGRLYIYGKSSEGHYAVVAEVNAQTGEAIKRVRSTRTGSTIGAYHVQLIDNEIYFCVWTGHIDVADLNLNIVRSHSLNNAVGNTMYGCDIDITKDRVIFPQTANDSVVIKNLSGSFTKGISAIGYSWTCCFTQSYAVACLGGQVKVIDPIAGTEIKTITVTSSGQPCQPIEIAPDVVCLPSPFAVNEGFAIVDLVTSEVLFLKTSPRVGTGDWQGRAAKIGEGMVACFFSGEYGVYKLAKQILKR